MYPLDTLRHTAAHVMAQAVLRLWPDASWQSPCHQERVLL